MGVKKMAKKSLIHTIANVLVGMGLGVLITYPVVVEHPVRWGVGLVVIGALLRLYQVTSKK